MNASLIINDHLLVIVLHYIGVIELPQYVDLANDLVPLSVAHSTKVDLLPHQYLTVALSLDSVHRSETAYRYSFTLSS
jgi:hypothetical protein